MIRAEDAQFHPPDSDDPRWAETNYFGLYAAQDTPSPLHIGVYVLFREPLGVAGCRVAVNSKRVRTPWEAEYWDAWEHLVVPQPSNLTDYRLANGLSVVCAEPNASWVVDYSDAAAGLDLHFRYSALMPPYDINDPDQDPRAAHRDAWGGKAYTGHFDQSGVYEGEISLRGVTHEINCVSTMDHSWGPRSERQTSRLSWLHAHFSRDLVVHALCDFSTEDGPDRPSTLTLTHGYVLDKGTLRGLKAGTGSSLRTQFYPEATSLTVVDTDDHTWKIEGTALTTFPWQAWSGVVGYSALQRWACNGLTGYGEVMDFIGLREIGSAYNPS